MISPDRRFPRTLLFLCVLSAAALPVSLRAAQETGTIIIEQQSPNDIMGEWVLIKPGNKRLSLQRQSYTLSDAPLGNYTLLVEPPAGAEATVRLFLEQDLLDSFAKPQASFTLEQNMNIRLRIEYAFLRVGVIGINSQPPGLGYTLRGPNDFETSSTTPQSYRDMPEGLYSITYDRIQNCPVPRPTSDKLIAGSRINFTITFNCEGVRDMAQQATYERSLQFVTAQVEGKQVTFSDVPLDQWFAPFVSKTLKTGIMSGFKDDDGNPSGRFGPGENVTIAQLAKIAHELANIDEYEAKKRPANVRAHGTWFERYIASAEELDWFVFRDRRIDPDRPATRAEVIATLLQALDVRLFWAQGNLFSDVRKNTEYASTIETASKDGIVSGFTDSSGNPTGRFGPENPVNRAEMAKIIGTAIDIYVEGAATP